MTIPIVKTTFIFVLLNEFFIRLFPHSAALKIIPAAFLFMSGILLSIYAYKNFYRFKNIPLYFKFLFLLLFIWSLFTIFRSVNSNLRDLITLFTHYRVGGWDWVSPLAVFFGFSVINWFKIFPLLVKFLLFGILFSFLSIVTGLNLTAFTLLSVFPVLLLTYSYHSTIVKRIVVISIFVYAFYGFVILSNRSSVAILILMLSFFLFEYLRGSNNNGYKKIFIFISFLLFSVFVSIQANSMYNRIANDKELTTDTRTFLAIEMFNDMSENELLIGRGALGQYYSPYFAILKREGVKGGDSPIRSTNEIGYLHMILKGGYIMMALYLLILVPAAYLGIVKSKNLLARMSGYIILSFIIMFVLIYPPEYRIDFIILWMAVGTAITKSIREMSDKDLLKIRDKEFF